MSTRPTHHINMLSQPVIFSSASLRLHLSKLFCHSFPLYNISCHLFYFHPLLPRQDQHAWLQLQPRAHRHLRHLQARGRQEVLTAAWGQTDDWFGTFFIILHTLFIKISVRRRKSAWKHHNKLNPDDSLGAINSFCKDLILKKYIFDFKTMCRYL